jgi:hypothetical protein
MAPPRQEHFTPRELISSITYVPNLSRNPPVESSRSVIENWPAHQSNTLPQSELFSANMFDNNFPFPDAGSAFPTFAFTDFFPSTDVVENEVALSAEIHSSQSSSRWYGDTVSKHLGSYINHSDRQAMIIPSSLSPPQDPSWNNPSPTADFETVGAGQQNNGQNSERILPETRRKALLAFFERKIHPPASLVDADPLGWSHMQRYCFE